VAGNQYLFRIRGKNIYGFGDYSDTVSLIPDGVPAMMNEITTELSYPDVIVIFFQPFNNGRTITGYNI
jgi:hypothetical protein